MKKDARLKFWFQLQEEQQVRFRLWDAISVFQSTWTKKDKVPYCSSTQCQIKKISTKTKNECILKWTGPEAWGRRRGRRSQPELPGAFFCRKIHWWALFRMRARVASDRRKVGWRMVNVAVVINSKDTSWINLIWWMSRCCWSVSFPSVLTWLGTYGAFFLSNLHPNLQTDQTQ